jgi:glycosyltransferase involved in cell wall biosynthesis
MSTTDRAGLGGPAAAAAAGVSQSEPAAQPAVSVVITTTGSLPQLVESLRALDNQVGLPAGSVELVVVSDGSPEISRRTLASLELATPLVVVEQVRCGHASARNAGWQAARGRLVVFLGASLAAGPDLVAAHLAAYQAQTRQLVLGRVTSDPFHEPSPWQAYDDAVLARKYARLGIYEDPSGLHNGDHFSLPRELLVEVEGYRSTMSVNSDVDLGIRLGEAGVGFVYLRDAQAFRTGGCDYSDWLRMHRIRGRFEVAAYRQQGYRSSLRSLVGCYHDRRLLIRLVVRLGLISPTVERATLAMAEWVGINAWRLRLRPLALLAMSCLANLLYWSGICEGLRGRRAFWRLVHETRGTGERPYRRLKLRHR